jgi:UDP-N-acetylmuramate dehydrogenase
MSVWGRTEYLDTQRLINRLIKRLPDLRISRDEPMSRHTSFHIGGTAALMAFPTSGTELQGICEAAAELYEPPFVFGNGTNLLVQDGPLNIFAVKTSEGMTKAEYMGDGTIRAESGILLSKLAMFALKNSLTGLEFAHGIPGTLGGAVSMNAGAYGGEIGAVVTESTYLEDNGFEIMTVKGAEHDFSYRHSAFSDSCRVVLESKLLLSPGDAEEIRAKMDELASRRRASQPLELPSGGSTFKRPKGGYAAALIDEAGLKGLRVGGAQVSEKHAGFIVNTGGASCEDVLRLIDMVREAVLKQSGIMLEPEIKYIRI